MVAHITHDPGILSSTQLNPASRRHRLIWLLSLLTASAAAAIAGIAVAVAVAVELTRSSTVAPAADHEPYSNSQEAPGSTPGRSSSAAGQARPQRSPEYLWRWA